MVDCNIEISEKHGRPQRQDRQKTEALSECLAALEDMQRKLDFLQIRINQIQKRDSLR